MKHFNINANLIRKIQNLYDKATSAVYLNNSIGDWLRTTVGVRQSCVLSPTLFNIFLERSMAEAETEKRTQAMEMRCLRKLLGIMYREHITNEEVRNRTRQAIGPHEDLLTTVKQRKLRWYGHITRSSGHAKTVMQGTVQGGRRRGRQKMRWEDNIPEWTGMTLGAAMRKADRREEWRELVAKSSVVPQRSNETTE